jgi:threonylcarbamoyladenosine tRNA methylthiotransferase MtaB
MKRRYRSAGFLERCRRLREVLDQPAFTTDIIVGFPGETAADFEATCRVARVVGFAKMHIFSYSPRRGTSAVHYPGRVPPAVITERRERVRELERELALAYQRSLIDRRLEVLVEGADPRRPGHVLGTSCRHVPVAFKGHAPALLRRLVPVRVTEVSDGALLARPEPDPHLTPLEPPAIPLRSGRLPLTVIG